MAQSRGRVRFVIRKKTEPKYKVEINNAKMGFVDVSSYVIEQSSFSSQTTEIVGTGQMALDRNVLVDGVLANLNSNDEIKIYLNYTYPDTHVFTGVIGNIEDLGNRLNFDFADFGKLVTQRTHTGVFRQDSGTGNLVEDVIKSILTIKFPELTYTSTSLPATTEEFFRYAPQNTPCSEIFDYVANILNRQWWVDKDKVFHMRNRIFTDSGVTITAGKDIIGDLIIATDVSRWANYVIVDGRTFLVGFSDSFTGDGVTTVFNLSSIPFDIEVQVSGVFMTGSFSGALDYTKSDYLIDQLAKTITFQNNAPVSGDTVKVDYRYMVKVHEELSDEASITEFRRVDKYLPVGAVESQAEAFNIANNYLTLYSKPLKIYTARVIGTVDFNIAQQVTLVDSVKGINKLVNVVGMTHSFGTAGWVTDIQMTDFPAGFPDLYADLLARIRRLEELDKISGQFILNYQTYGSRYDVGIVSSLWKQSINDSMVWSHPSGTNGTWGTAKWGDRRSAETLVYEDM